MRPTEKARKEELLQAALEGGCYAYKITTFPPIKVNDTFTDGGFIGISMLDSCCKDSHSLKARIARAWKSWRGCPDTLIHLETVQDLDNVIAALQRARAKAFPEETDPRSP